MQIVKAIGIAAAVVATILSIGLAVARGAGGGNNARWRGYEELGTLER